MAAGHQAPRRIFHAVAGSLPPLGGLLLPDGYLIAVLGILAGSSLSLDLARLQWPWLNRQFQRWLRPLLKPAESSRITGATYLLIAALACFVIFDRHVAVAALFFLSLGDPAAALVGRPMPGPRLFGKSPIGSLAFITVALLTAWGLTAAGVAPWHWGLAAGAVVAGLVELLPLPGDDNLYVPLLSGAAMQYWPIAG